MIPPAIDSLVDLGLTPVEAETYAYLLTRRAATGYAVAKGTGKPTANTYKALASLFDKGAVIKTGSTREQFRAVPPEEFLNALEWRFADRRRRAAGALADIETPDDERHVFQLSGTEQVAERLRKMVARADRHILAELPEGTGAWCENALTAARHRGVAVIVRTPEERFPASVVAAVDRREVLVAAVDRGPAATLAVWTANPAMATVLWDAWVGRFFYATVAEKLAEGMSMDELEETFEHHRRLHDNARP